MNLDKLYKLQEELDSHILDKHDLEMTKEGLLDNTILALLVEVGELANVTRCFKHWSTKGMMDKEVVLDELADVIHFYLSIGNQVGFKVKTIKSHEYLGNMTNLFNFIYRLASGLTNTETWRKDFQYMYRDVGEGIHSIYMNLGFTDEEVEQAYLKKHEENYKRQREGY